jgi:hypothetical protein
VCRPWVACRFSGPDVRTTHLDYESRRKPKTDYSCVACQKDIDPGRPHRRVALLSGTDIVVHPEDVDLPVSDEVKQQTCETEIVWHPLGNDCAKKLGLEWSEERP